MERAEATSSRNDDVCLWDSDDDDENDRIHTRIWEHLLGVPIDCWSTVEVNERNGFVFRGVLKTVESYKKDTEEYLKKIEEENKLNENEKFSYVEIQPRFPRPPYFFLWFKKYRMRNTKPTSLRSKRFTEPSVHEHMEMALLQFFSIRFAGDFVKYNTMSVYGFLAVRDNLDYLRNHVFHRSREQTIEISSDSRNLPLISPARGISAYHGVLVEYFIQAKRHDSRSDINDDIVVDGCFECKSDMFNTIDGSHKVRIYGSFGPMDISFSFIRYAVEATIDVKIQRAAKGYDLKAVTAFTSGYPHAILLYDSSSRAPIASNDDFPLVVVASAVVAVELDGELKLVFDFGVEDKRITRKLYFTGQKHRSSKRAVKMRSMFKLLAKVTWSTLGIRSF